MNEVDHQGKYAGLLTVAETGLGSVLHAYHVPLAGHFLSLNQGFLLSRSVESGRKISPWTPYKISLMAAAMKSLSPMGKRLTPMLGISVQGLLFSLGVFIFGTNVVGAMVGMFMLSIWAFAQPALTLFLIFGKNLVQVLEFYYQEAQELLPFDMIYLGYFFLALILTKVILAQALVYLAFSSRKHEVEEKLNKLSQMQVTARQKSDAGPDTFGSRLKNVGKDLLQPWFLISLVMSFLFFYLTNPLSIKVVWYLLRPISIAAILFYLKRCRWPFRPGLLKIP